MSMQDPISDMLVRIKNGQKAKHESVLMPASKLKTSILKVLKAEGYIEHYDAEEASGHPFIRVALKYFEGQPVIEFLRRVSRPGCRRYKGCKELTPVRRGLGCAIVSTSQGVMTDARARALRLGGEVLCVVA